MKTEADKTVSLLEDASATDDRESEGIENMRTLRRKIAKEIDPATADIEWCYGYVIDPYGEEPDLPDECKCIGRLYFAKPPDAEVWISFCDIDDDVREVLWERLKSEPDCLESSFGELFRRLVADSRGQCSSACDPYKLNDS